MEYVEYDPEFDAFKHEKPSDDTGEDTNLPEGTSPPPDFSGIDVNPPTSYGGTKKQYLSDVLGSYTAPDPYGMPELFAAWNQVHGGQPLFNAAASPTYKGPGGNITPYFGPEYTAPSQSYQNIPEFGMNANAVFKTLTDQDPAVKQMIQEFQVKKTQSAVEQGLIAPGGVAPVTNKEALDLVNQYLSGQGLPPIDPWDLISPPPWIPPSGGGYIPPTPTVAPRLGETPPQQPYDYSPYQYAPPRPRPQATFRRRLTPWSVFRF